MFPGVILLIVTQTKNCQSLNRAELICVLGLYIVAKKGFVYLIREAFLEAKNRKKLDSLINNSRPTLAGSTRIIIIIIIIIIKAYTALIQTVLSALQFINSR